MNEWWRTAKRRMVRVWRNKEGKPYASGHKFKRNEPCPCQSGLKFKNCHGR